MAYPAAVERWRSTVAKYFRPEDVDKALHVIMYESGGDPKAWGDGGSSLGLFQLHEAGVGSGMSAAARYDPEANIRAAAQAVYGGQGWAPWGENNLYNGQPFGALGNHPYQGQSLSNTVSRLPVAGGTITAVFGPTNEPLDSGGFNKGLDIGVPVGTAVSAVVGGTVVAAGDQGDGWGISIKIRDANGNIHNYGHLSAANVQVGQTVSAGAVIAASGNTGASTGPHLSYDVLGPNGQFIDPSPFLGFNASGDNRAGHPAIGQDIASLGGTDVPYQDWLNRYAPIYNEWKSLDERIAPYVGNEALGISGVPVYVDPVTGALVAVTVNADGFEENITILSPEETARYFELDETLVGLETEFETSYQGESLEDAINRATFFYETSNENIDALNAADEFARDMDIRDQALGMSKEAARQQEAQLDAAFETQTGLRNSVRPGITGEEQAVKPAFMVARPKKLLSADELFDSAVSKLESSLPAFTGRPYFDTAGIADTSRTIDQARLDARGMRTPSIGLEEANKRITSLAPASETRGPGSLGLDDFRIGANALSPSTHSDIQGALDERDAWWKPKALNPQERMESRRITGGGISGSILNASNRITSGVRGLFG